MLSVTYKRFLLSVVMLNAIMLSVVTRNDKCRGAHEKIKPRVEPVMRLDSNGMLLVLSTNISLGLKWIVVVNVLAYYSMTAIATVKSFIAHTVKNHFR